MKTIMTRFGFAAICLAITLPAISEEELLDPRMRDEDISGSQVSVEVSTRPDGLYEYVYSIDAPETNLGTIMNFDVDLTCNHDFGEGVMPDPIGKEGYTGIRAEPGTFTPVAVFADRGAAALYGVNAASVASYLVYQRPGEQRTGIRLISPVAPGLRSYVLIPAMDNDERWDYPEEPDATIPWVPDFTVAGRIAGPGCPGLIDPIEENPTFPGSREGNEREIVNDLLRYEAPMQDRLHAVNSAVQVTILYGDNIDPASFKVTPANLRKLFTPAPGGKETVSVPVGPGKTILRFEARLGKPAPSERANHRDSDEPSFSEKDVDVFEIRNEMPAGNTK